LNLLEPVKLTVWKVMIERVTVVKFRVNYGGGNGAGCFEIKVWADTAKFTDVIVARLRKCSDLIREAKVFVENKTKVASRVGCSERAVLYFRELLFTEPPGMPCQLGNGNEMVMCELLCVCVTVCRVRVMSDLDTGTQNHQSVALDMEIDADDSHTADEGSVQRCDRSVPCTKQEDLHRDINHEASEVCDQCDTGKMFSNLKILF